MTVIATSATAGLQVSACIKAVSPGRRDAGNPLDWRARILLLGGDSLATADGTAIPSPQTMTLVMTDPSDMNRTIKDMDEDDLVDGETFVRLLDVTVIDRFTLAARGYRRISRRIPR